MSRGKLKETGMARDTDLSMGARKQGHKAEKQCQGNTWRHIETIVQFYYEENVKFG